MIDLDSIRAFRTIRLVVAAMATGVLAFGAMVVFMITGGVITTNPALANILLLTLAGLAFVEVVAYTMVRAICLDRARRAWNGAVADESSVDGVLSCFSTLTLIGAAMAEGFGLFGIVIFLLAGAWVAIAASALALLVIAIQFPSRARFTSFARNVTGRHWE